MSDVAAVIVSVAVVVVSVALLLVLSRPPAPSPACGGRWTTSTGPPSPCWPTPTWPSRRPSFDLDRVDTLLTTVESIAGTVDSASRMAHNAVGSPLVKVMATGAGRGRGLAPVPAPVGRPAGRHRRSGRR